MRRPESSIERAACARVRKLYGVESVKLNIGGNAGYPDRLFLIPGGRPLFVEFKRPGGKLTKMQKHVHGKLRRAGYDVQVHDDVAKAVGAVFLKCGTAGYLREQFSTAQYVDLRNAEWAAALDAARRPKARGKVPRRA